MKNYEAMEWSMTADSNSLVQPDCEIIQSTSLSSSTTDYIEPDLAHRMSSVNFDVEMEEDLSLYSCSSNTSISSLALTPVSQPSLASPLTRNKVDRPNTALISHRPFDEVFYYYNSFPLSIRIKIWALLLPTERIIPFSHQTFSPLPKPLSQICRLTRYIVLSRFRPLFDDRAGQDLEPKAFLAPQRDTILIDIYEKGLGDSLKTAGHGVLPHLRSIALKGWDIMFDTRSRTPWLELECLLQIPNLCKLNLVYVSARDHGIKDLSLVPAFTILTSDWPDEIEEDDLDMLVREDVAGCCQALKFEELKNSKLKVEKIREVLAMFKAMNSDWRMPRVRVRILVRTERQGHRVNVPDRSFEDWW